MPGEDEGVTPTASPVKGGEGRASRIAERDRLAGVPEAEGVPEQEGLDDADVGEALDADPGETRNRRDVPPTPENSIEARTEDGSGDEITAP